jgi:hypothetical protein
MRIVVTDPGQGTCHVEAIRWWDALGIEITFASEENIESNGATGAFGSNLILRHRARNAEDVCRLMPVKLC